MSTFIPLHASPETSRLGDEMLGGDIISQNPLPQVLHTPSGLALLELQGTINLPAQDDSDTITSTDITGGLRSQETPIGRLVFPLFDSHKADGGSGWMKKVYLYVGKHQRLTGEVKKLPKAIAVIRKRAVDGSRTAIINDGMEVDSDHSVGKEELEILEIVKYKIIFSTRPEPVGTLAAGE